MTGPLSCCVRDLSILPENHAMHAERTPRLGRVAYSHLETRCSDEMRRSVPDTPRSTTLSV
jgi:hypothetical protein